MMTVIDKLDREERRRAQRDGVAALEASGALDDLYARIDAGDYGYCDETGEPIGVGRLLARPTATLSLEAQQRRELKQKMFGD